MRRLTEAEAAPLRGGAVTVREPTLLPLGSFSWIQNVRPKRPGFIKRPGQIVQHTVADGSNQVVTLYQFRKPKTDETFLFAQMSDGDILQATTAPPAITTGVFGAEVYDGSSGQIPASWSALDEIMVMSNGADQHKTYAGTASFVDKFLVYRGSDSIADTPQEGEDFSTEVADGQSSTVAVLDSLSSSPEGFLCATPVPAQSFTFTIAAANSSGAGLNAYYRKSDNTWAAVSGLSDGTESGGATLAQTGTVSFTAPSDEIPVFLYGRMAYWYLFVITFTYTASDDLTTYTEVDSGSDITVSSTTVTVDTMERVANSSVSKSYGSNNFGDVVHRFKINWTAAEDTGNGTVYSISDTYFTEQDQQDNTDGIRVALVRSGAVYKMVLWDQEEANQDDFDFGSLPGERWIEFQRASTVATVKIYTDSGFLTLEDTLTVTCNTTQYEFHCVAASRDAAGVPEISFTSGNHTFRSATTLDAEVEISSVTFDSTWASIANLWDGVPQDGVEIMVEGTTTFGTYGASAVNVSALPTGKKILMAFTDPIEGVYWDVGGTPNATGTALTSLKYWDGDSYATVGAVTDSTNGLSNSGWMRFARPSIVHPKQEQGTQYYAYWYEVIFDTNLSADMVIGIQSMPYFAVNDFGKIGVASSTWRDRMTYTFNEFPEYVYITGQNNISNLNGFDFGILQAGDGRPNRVLSMKPFYNNLFVFQEEKGVEGGCTTIFQGYGPDTYGKLLLSSRIGIMNAKCAAVIEGVLTSTATDEKLNTLVFWLSRYGICVSDGRTISIISDDIQNYFDYTKDECIRFGYEAQHWLEFDATWNVLRVGLVSGSSATTPNVFPVFDLTDKVWYFDNLGQELSCIRGIEPGSGNVPLVYVGGGVDDGIVYNLNTSTNDVSTAIDSYFDMELNYKRLYIALTELILGIKAQAAGDVTLTISANGIQKQVITLSMVAEVANQIVRRHWLSLNEMDQNIRIRIQHNTAGQDAYFEDLGLGLQLWEGR